ncbi:MAG: YncE family protein, partial [Acidimicrobiales bacterium]
MLAAVALLATGCTTGVPGASRPAISGVEAWVCNFAYMSQPGDTIASVNLAAPSVGPSVRTGRLPSALAALPGGHTLLVTDEAADNLVEIDTATHGVVSSARTGVEPDAVAVGGPGGDLALVANLGSNTVTPIDLTDMKAGAPIA